MDFLGKGCAAQLWRYMTWKEDEVSSSRLHLKGDWAGRQEKQPSHHYHITRRKQTWSFQCGTKGQARLSDGVRKGSITDWSASLLVASARFWKGAEEFGWGQVATVPTQNWWPSWWIFNSTVLKGRRERGKKNTAQTHRERQRETERERRHSADWITRNGCPLVGSESLSIRFVDWRVGREDFPIVANLRRRFQPSAVCVRLSVCVFSPHLPNQPVVAYPCFF